MKDEMPELLTTPYLTNAAEAVKAWDALQAPQV
jgi:hypothetical protein